MAHELTDGDAVCEEVVDKLMHIITWAFNDSFSFSTNHIDTDIAVNICLVLRVGGSPGRAATRIAALMRALLGSGKRLRAQYPHDRMGNAMFYEAVAQDVRDGGISGAGIGPQSHSMIALTSATTKTPSAAVRGRS